MEPERPIEIIIDSIPIPKKRPRFARMGKFVKTYNPQKKEELSFQREVKTKWEFPPIPGPISLFIYYYLPIPKSASKKDFKRMAEKQVIHCKKPDIDNLQKWTLDCLNGLVWVDDSQIFSISAIKEYSEKPGTIIHIHTV